MGRLDNHNNRDKDDTDNAMVSMLEKEKLKANLALSRWHHEYIGSGAATSMVNTNWYYLKTRFNNRLNWNYFYRHCEGGVSGHI